MDEQVAFLLLHPVIMPVTPFNFFRLHLKVLIQSVKSLLLQVYLSLGPRVTDLFVLLHLELMQLSVLGNR